MATLKTNALAGFLARHISEETRETLISLAVMFLALETRCLVWALIMAQNIFLDILRRF